MFELSSVDLIVNIELSLPDLLKEKSSLRVLSIQSLQAYKGDGHLESKSAQRLVLLKLLILLVNIYMVDVKDKYLSYQRKSS